MDNEALSQRLSSALVLELIILKRPARWVDLHDAVRHGHADRNVMVSRLTACRSQATALRCAWYVLCAVCGVLEVQQETRNTSRNERSLKSEKVVFVLKDEQ